MRQIFVDTSAFYAMADRKDPAHPQALNFLAENDLPLLTTNYVFAETVSLLTKRLGKSVALRFGENLRANDSVRVFSLTPEYEEAAWKEFRRYKDKDFDFVDSSSFAVMERQGIDTAFSFDRHFRQRGFELRP